METNDQFKWIAMMLMLFSGDNPTKPGVNPKDVSMALKCCVVDKDNIQSRSCNDCPYAKYASEGCENKMKLDAAKLIDYVVATEIMKGLKKENDIHDS